MSRKVLISSLSDNDLKEISADLQIKKEQSKYCMYAAPTYICAYDVKNSDELFLPFSYASGYSRPNRKNLKEIKVNFVGELRQEQKNVQKEAIDSINKKGSIIISAYPGFGKTCTALNISSKIRLKTMILCHRIILLKQWKASIEKFCPNSTVKIIESKCVKKDFDNDFLIMTASNVPKHPESYYKNIGFLIVDEIHIIMAEKMSKCMHYFTPRYLLGLSATPYRNDGLDILLDLYFGKEKIERKLLRKHILYRLETGIKPTVELNVQGKIIWDSVLKSQAENDERNEMIIKIIKHFSDRFFLVLCKRVIQAKYIFNRLKEEKLNVTSLIGNEQTFDRDAKILVGISQKSGTGFDHDKIDSIILATDFEDYFEQYLGRAFRREDVEPLIFDFIDNHGILLKHSKTRMKKCLENGGIVKNFDEEFPNFFSDE